LFLYRCIELLKEDGLLTFIIPDTFLNLHMHKALRSYILKTTKIIKLSLFPSSFFSGVNFGYANLSIITLQKNCKQNNCLNNQYSEPLKIQTYTQKDIFSNPEHAFFISDNKSIVNT
jgi:adenine-specific DNA-methyltransferase